MALKHKMDRFKKPVMRDLNPAITCRLCEGYFIDATTLVECLHTFCRSCIIRYLETSKTQCPMCPTDKKKPQNFRPDPQIQSLVYKLVPSLYFKEMQRREDFYRSTGMRAGSSCSDDSVIERERDMMNESEETIAQCVGDKAQYLSPEDSISLSLEYYQVHLDDTDIKPDKKPSAEQTQTQISDGKDDGNCVKDKNVKSNGVIASDDKHCRGDKRYLSCPAAVNMKHLQKFIRMKHGLTSDHRVDIIYKGEVLTTDFSLMDVAYTFKWERKKPMRFFYRIFTPSTKKIRPIKIVNTALSTGGKQLQVVPITPSYNSEPPQPKPEKVPSPETKPVEEPATRPEETENEKQDKERLFAHLQLQSKFKTQTVAPQPPVPEKLIKDCVFEYEEPDQEEIKRFAEKRDREWALQKKFEEDTRQEEEYANYHVTKKRKKSKHSKNESNSYKKRKLHAEITSNEKEDLKLKVKITTNGHKHKHHNKTEISAKEKLLQMRQVRHKHTEDRGQPVIPTIKLPKIKESPTFYCPPEPKKKKEIAADNNNKPSADAAIKIHPVAIKSAQEATSSLKPPTTQPSAKPEPSPPKTARKEWSGQSDKQAQKTFLKTIQSYAKSKATDDIRIPNKAFPISTNNKSLERKIASLQQRCTIEPKPSANTGHEKPTDKKVMRTPQYPPGFTVSKVEVGTKRKADGETDDKRPSLEITLINPQTPKPAETKPVAKRPLPGTIPLERIKNSMNLKSGISIIPKLPDRCDNIGALDLSKPSRSPERPKIEPPPNGLNKQLTNVSENVKNNNVQLSNLQMLSKVATEHSSLNKAMPNQAAKPRPQIPSLQAINQAVRGQTLQRLPSKPNEIPKFRPVNPQIRSLRPNQNQNIRNIPNPSLLMNRQQQNQTRLAVSAQPPEEKKPEEVKPQAVVTPGAASVPKELVTTKSSIVVEQKVPEKKEISV
ncbi:polycomb group protein Psc-like [Cylas formicarius]|uniref:polycomb group protein Psc-like n=1 Tax=Cylas formicarius TaxID=197179 RepID=UPI002958B0A6|nr:polycomb group protein Psc-like [Cylas formicarius]